MDPAARETRFATTRATTRERSRHTEASFFWVFYSSANAVYCIQYCR